MLVEKIDPAIDRIMLIDDNEIDMRHYKRVLSRSGLVGDILCFNYADEALDYFRNPAHDPVDVILLDINMPRLNGFEFLETASHELARNFAQVVIIMITTSLDPKDRKRAEAFEIVRDFLNKPLEVADVRHAAELLRQAREAG